MPRRVVSKPTKRCLRKRGTRPKTPPSLPPPPTPPPRPSSAATYDLRCSHCGNVFIDRGAFLLHQQNCPSMISAARRAEEAHQEVAKTSSESQSFPSTDSDSVIEILDSDSDVQILESDSDIEILPSPTSQLTTTIELADSGNDTEMMAVSPKEPHQPSASVSPVVSSKNSNSNSSSSESEDDVQLVVPKVRLKRVPHTKNDYMIKEDKCSYCGDSMENDNKPIANCTQRHGNKDSLELRPLAELLVRLPERKRVSNCSETIDPYDEPPPPPSDEEEEVDLLPDDAKISRPEMYETYQHLYRSRMPAAFTQYLRAVNANKFRFYSLGTKMRDKRRSVILKGFRETREANDGGQADEPPAEADLKTAKYIPSGDNENVYDWNINEEELEMLEQLPWPVDLHQKRLPPAVESALQLIQANQQQQHLPCKKPKLESTTESMEAAETEDDITSTLNATLEALNRGEDSEPAEAFKCRTCGQAFLKSAHLAEHQLIHKPQCQQCHRRFSDPSAWEVHHCRALSGQQCEVDPEQADPGEVEDSLIIEIGSQTTSASAQSLSPCESASYQVVSKEAKLDQKKEMEVEQQNSIQLEPASRTTADNKSALDTPMADALEIIYIDQLLSQEHAQTKNISSTTATATCQLKQSSSMKATVTAPSTNTRPYVCTECNQSDFPSLQQYRQHCETFHKWTGLRSRGHRWIAHLQAIYPLTCNNNPDVFFRCPECRIVFESQITNNCAPLGQIYRQQMFNKLRDHFTSHRTARCFACRNCNAAYTDPAHLEEHLKAHDQQKTSSVLDCPTCAKVTAPAPGALPRRASAESHRCLHQSSMYICYRCNEPFAFLAILERHLGRCEVERCCEI